MQIINKEVAAVFGGQVRVRACGICIQDERILLAGHYMYDDGNAFWAPPGGGIAAGETAQEALVREFREETGLLVEVGELLFVNEHISPPLHAIELFFGVTIVEGTLLTGTDPELSPNAQIIGEVQWMDWEQIRAMEATQVHSLFHPLKSLPEIFTISKFIQTAKV